MIDSTIVDSALEAMGKGRAQYEYFFDSLASSTWIEPLSERGLLKNPPPLESSGERSYWSRWPESRFLARVASTGSREVVDAFLNMKETDNPFIHCDLVDAALAMQPSVAAALIEKEADWIAGQEYIDGILTPDYGKLIRHLAEGREKDAALKLARAILDVIPEEDFDLDTEIEGQHDTRKAVFSRPSSRIGQSYGETLKEDVPALIKETTLAGVAMLCNLLEKAIRISRTNADEHRPYDISTIWLPAVEDTEFTSGQIEKMLAQSIRDAVLRLVKDEQCKVEECVELLESMNWDVYQRISLYLLSQFAHKAPGLVRSRLLDSHLFHSHSLHHEFFTLAGTSFDVLEPDERDKFKDLIERGLPSEDVRSGTEEEIERDAKVWKCRRLHVIRSFLHGDQERIYRELSAELGDAGTADFLEYRIGRSWVGPTSDLETEDIKTMSNDELLRYLNEWVPSGEWASATPEGLSRILSEASESSPERFSVLSPKFIGFEPTYVRGVLQGLERVVRNKGEVSWKPLLDLSGWVVKEHRGNVDNEEDYKDKDPGWGWTRKTIASLLMYGLRDGPSEIPFRHREDVWELLEILCEDQEPTPDYEKTYGGSNMSPVDLSINVVRGHALHALVEYAIWVRRNLEEPDEENTKPDNWIGKIREAQKVLELHLDSEHDPSQAVRAVYGQQFGRLVWLDEDWAAKCAPKIFGGDSPRSGLDEAAWQAYIVFNRPYRQVLEILDDVYIRSVECLSPDSDAENAHRFDSDHRLADHLVLFYLRGDLETEKRKGLLNRFFERGSDTLRAHAIDFAGECARSAYGENKDEVLTRLQNLWADRMKKAREAADISGFKAELSAFGAWLVANRFEESWALEQLEDVLNLTGCAEPDHLVARRLSKVSESHFGKALSCFELMAKGARDDWVIMSWKNSLKDLVVLCLKSEDSKVCKQATDLIDLLAALGFPEFTELLKMNEEK